MDRISVVAPASGVEAMDALVDGMNGFGVDDRYLNKHTWSARPSKTERAGAHPLYHPPLPPPPPGIRLGGALPRGQSENSTDDDGDREGHDPYNSKRISDLGCSTGYPLVVFLGLGCVRHVIGVYDEMAECLGLRLIAIDR